MANKAEIMGGLSVAAIQFAIGLAAAIGGIIYDHQGIQGIFLSSALIFIAALLLIKTSFAQYTRTTAKPFS
ncbi:MULTISPECIES: MFS transporter [Snodgrassella]|uniref:MFS transporter n=1 Tax=Snodgrassella TaxID=1193515 RepID=UPI001184B415|nr:MULTISPECIES: MFS transporter [Snodgrassella]